ncbi:unnamed protein product [Arctogadus glacialis]
MWLCGCALCTGDGSQSFLSWARQLEVAASATAGGGYGCTEELVRPSVWRWRHHLEEALHVAERCENAGVALQRDYLSTAAAAYGGGSPSVQSVSVSEGLQRAVEKLTEDMHTMRVGIK